MTSSVDTHEIFLAIARLFQILRLLQLMAYFREKEKSVTIDIRNIALAKFVILILAAGESGS